MDRQEMRTELSKQIINMALLPQKTFSLVRGIHCFRPHELITDYWPGSMQGTRSAEINKVVYSQRI